MFKRTEAGFTLLEVMFALSIMVIAFAGILQSTGNSMRSSERARQMNIAAMLARQAMIEAENTFQGKTFSEVKKEDGAQFPEPYTSYSWKREIKELEFPKLGGGKKKDGDGGDGKEGGADPDMITKLIAQFFSKAIREVVVTISWKKAGGEQKISVTTYWVDLNHEFALSE